MLPSGSLLPASQKQSSPKEVEGPAVRSQVIPARNLKQLSGGHSNNNNNSSNSNNNNNNNNNSDNKSRQNLTTQRAPKAQEQQAGEGETQPTTNRHSSNYLASLVNRSGRLLLHSLWSQYESALSMQRSGCGSAEPHKLLGPSTSFGSSANSSSNSGSGSQEPPPPPVPAPASSSLADNNNNNNSNSNNYNATASRCAPTNSVQLASSALAPSGQAGPIKQPRRHALQEQSLERDGLRLGRVLAETPKWRRATSIKSVLRGVSGGGGSSSASSGSSGGGKPEKGAATRPCELFEPPITQRTVQRSRRRGAMLGDPRRQLSADTIGLRQLTDEYLQNAGVVTRKLPAALSSVAANTVGSNPSNAIGCPMTSSCPAATAAAAASGLVALTPPEQSSSVGLPLHSVVQPLLGQSGSRDNSGESTVGCTAEDLEEASKLPAAHVYPGELPWQNDVSVQCELVRAPRLRQFGLHGPPEEPYESTGDILQTIAGPYRPPPAHHAVEGGASSGGPQLAASLRRGLSAFAAASSAHHLVSGIGGGHYHSSSAALQVVGSLKKSLSNTLDISSRAALVSSTLHSQDSLPAYASLRNEPDDDEEVAGNTGDEEESECFAYSHNSAPQNGRLRRKRRENSSDVEGGDLSPPTSPATTSSATAPDESGAAPFDQLQPPAFPMTPTNHDSSLIGQLASKLTRQSSRKIFSGKRGLQRALSFDCRGGGGGGSGYKKLADKHGALLSVSSGANQQHGGKQSQQHRQKPAKDRKPALPHQRSALCLDVAARPAPLQQSASQVDFQLPLLPYHKMQEAIVAGRLLEPAPAPPPSPMHPGMGSAVVSSVAPHSQDAEQLLCAPVSHTTSCCSDEHPVLTPQAVPLSATCSADQQKAPAQNSSTSSARLHVPGRTTKQQGDASDSSRKLDNSNGDEFPSTERGTSKYKEDANSHSNEYKTGEESHTFDGRSSNSVQWTATINNIDFLSTNSSQAANLLQLPSSPSFCIQSNESGQQVNSGSTASSGLLSANDLFGAHAKSLIKRPSTVLIGGDHDGMSQVAQALSSSGSGALQSSCGSFAGGSSIRRNRRQAIVPPKLVTDSQTNQVDEGEPAVEQLVNIDDQLTPTDTATCALQSEEATVRALRRKRSGGAAERQNQSQQQQVAFASPASNQLMRRSSGALPTFCIEQEERSITSREQTGEQFARPDSRLTDGDSIISEGNSISPVSSKQDLTVTSPGGLTVSLGSSQNRRRSSIAVIPQMQICPGDLLVYSKQLIDRMNQSDEVIEQAPQFLPIDDKKGKNIWSSLKLFDTRTLKARNELLCSLEDVLASLQPSTFVDEQLSHYKGMLWNEFIYETESRRSASSVAEINIPNKVNSTNQHVTSQCKANDSEQEQQQQQQELRPVQLKVSAPLTTSPERSHEPLLQGKSSSNNNSPGASQRETLKASISSSASPTGGNNRSRDPGPRSTISSRFREKPKLKRGQTVDSVFRIPLIPSSPLKHAQQHQQTPTAHLEDHDLITIEDDESATSKNSSSLRESIRRRKHRSVSSSAARAHCRNTTNTPSELEKAETAGEDQQNGPLDGCLDSSFETDDAMDLLTGRNAASSSYSNNNGSDSPHVGHHQSGHPSRAHQMLRQSSLSTLSSTITQTEQKRQRALWDLFQSECTFFFDHLITLKNVYMEPLKKIQVEGFAMFADPDVLFGNLDELCCGVYDFCKEFLYIIMRTLKTRPEELNATDVLIKLYKKNPKIDHLRGVYHRYTLNYINALTYLESLRRQVEFVEFEKWSSRDVRCKKLQLTDLLVAPVQHIMRVPIILKDIESHTENLRDREEIRAILAIEEASLRELDDKMRWLKNFERLLEIQKSISWPSVLELDSKLFVPDFLKDALSRQPCEKLIVSPRRQIVHEGTLSNLDSGKACDMHVILFDDMLLLTRRKKGLTKKASTVCKTNSGGSSNKDDGTFKYTVYKQPLSLDRFYVHDVQQVDSQAIGLRHLFLLIVMNRFQQITNVHTFSAANDDTKQTWLFKIKKTSDRWKKNFSNNQNEQRPEHHIQSTNTPNVNDQQASITSSKQHYFKDANNAELNSTSNTKFDQHVMTEQPRRSQPLIYQEASTSKSTMMINIPAPKSQQSSDGRKDNYEISPQIELVVTSAPSGNSNENSTYSNITSTATAH